MIRIKSLEHKGGYYFYRLHSYKINELCNGLTNLKDYLEKVFNKCPDNYFNSGPRGSALKFKIDTNAVNVRGHVMSGLCRKGLEQNSERFRTAHSRVQVFMLENDANTIACEVPTWLEPKEINNFSEIFKSSEPLTGHIDVLRIEEGNVWVWDYKPSARQEKYASTQTFFYSLMLSKRTGIPLDKFRCGYFDEYNAFMFKPNAGLIEKKTLLNF